MQHLIASQNMTLTVFRLLFCKQIFKVNINNCYFNFLFLKFPATKYSKYKVLSCLKFTTDHKFQRPQQGLYCKPRTCSAVT